MDSTVISVHQSDTASLLLAHLMFAPPLVRPRLFPGNDFQNAPFSVLIPNSPDSTEPLLEILTTILVAVLCKVLGFGPRLPQSLRQDRQRQPQNALDSASPRLLLQVGSVVDLACIKPQGRDIDLPPPDPDRRLCGEWDPPGLDALALLLCVSSVLHFLGVHCVHVCFAICLICHRRCCYQL